MVIEEMVVVVEVVVVEVVVLVVVDLWINQDFFDFLGYLYLY